MGTLNEDQAKAARFIENWWLGKQRFMVLEGEAGSGKGNPLDEPVLTIDGWATMADLTVGSQVYTSTGELTEVLNIYELGIVNMYKITFNDGSFSRCCEDHLWQVQTRKQRELKTNGYRILPTKELLKDYKQGTNRTTLGGGFQYKYSIPLTKPINFRNCEVLDLDGYTLGYLLGNGSSSEKQLIISTHINDLIEVVSNISSKFILSSKHKINKTGIIAINKKGREFYNNLGLHKVKSIDKFIPKVYLFSSIENRKALLAGLLDSDGCCTNNKARFYSNSKQLSLDIVDLIHSLGGKASLHVQDRINKANTEFVVSLRLPFNPFYLGRKAKNYKLIPFDSAKSIISIEPIGYLKGRCIRVAHESHLYITRDYTVTHNTFLLKHIIGKLKDCVPLFTAPTNEACRQMEIVLPEGSLIKTTYSALGFNMSTNGELKELKQGRYCSVLNDINLLIVDEASMIGNLLHDAIKDTNLKVLFIGHRFQLPEVNIILKNDDLCKSIIFEQDYPTYTLTTNERASGELYNFVSKLPLIIYNQPRLFSSKYSNSETKLLEYIFSKEGKDSFLNEESKLICYSNREVDNYNKIIRESIFGKLVADVVPRDKLILIQPTNFVGMLDRVKKYNLIKMKDSDTRMSFATNTKAVVKHVKFAIVLGVDCHELDVEIKGERIPLYIPINEKQFEELKQGLKIECYSVGTAKAKEKAWNNYHYLISLFSHCKYSYCLTTHRAQGMTIDNVYVNWKDIKRCSNIYLRYKLLYVAASRVRNNLTIIG